MVSTSKCAACKESRKYFLVKLEDPQYYSIHTEGGDKKRRKNQLKC
jgi:hypothetical protein